MGCGDNPLSGIPTVLTSEQQAFMQIYEIRRLREDIFSIILKTDQQIKVGTLLNFEGIFSYVINSQGDKIKIFLKNNDSIKLSIDQQFTPSLLDNIQPKFNPMSFIVSHELSTSLAFYLEQVNQQQYYHLISCHTPDNLIYTDKYQAKDKRHRVICTGKTKQQKVTENSLPTKFIQQLICMGFQDIIVIGPLWLLKLIQLYVQTTGFQGQVFGLYFLYGVTRVLDYRWLDLNLDSLSQLIEFDEKELTFSQKIDNLQYQTESDQEELDDLIEKLKFRQKVVHDSIDTSDLIQ